MRLCSAHPVVIKRAPVRFGKYLLLDRLSIGGMAEVLYAKTHGSDRLLALKRVLPMLAEDDELVRMFVDEARLSSLLKHPNIVRVFDFGKYEDSSFLATEYIAGKDVRAILDRCARNQSRMSVAVAVDIAARVCSGLGYAHELQDANGAALNPLPQY